jgi:hypothetical protein
LFPGGFGPAEAHPDPVRTITVAARETATAATDSLPRLVPGTGTSQDSDWGVELGGRT